ncbi:MAG: T9SS type A sorting domain-containing protein, partial [Gemmatimonadota bacterium]
EFAQYVEADGKWIGSLKMMEPGLGYKLYLSKPDSDYFSYPLSSPIARYEFASEHDIHTKAADVMAWGTKVVGGRNIMLNGPDWSVDPHAYQYNMTVTGVVSVNENESRDEGDVIGAFVEGECRGVARPQYIAGIDRSLVFLMIHSNEVAGETVEFEAFDASAEVIRPVSETLTFEVDADHGSVGAPLVFNAGGVLSAELTDVLPTTYSLSQNYPNPFNPTTHIRFSLPDADGDRRRETGDRNHTTLKIYNMLGQEVRTLVDEEREAGYYTATWDSKNDNGSEVASGVYFCTLRAGDFTATKRMVLMK